MEASPQKTGQPHVAIIPTPGLGHLIPLTEFARQLVIRHNFSFTFLIPTDGSSTKSQLLILQNLPSSISYHFLSPVDLSDLPADAKILTRILLILSRSAPALRHSLRSLAESTRLVAIVFDVLGSPAIDLAAEFDVPPYIFYMSSAFSLCALFSMPNLDRMNTCEYRDLPEPVLFFPGCVPVHGVDLVEPVQDRKNESYNKFLELEKQYHKAAGIIVNSFVDLEPAAFKALMEDWEGLPPVHPIGLFVRTGSESELTGSDQCLKWLDKQPSGSVIFVSFGSGGTLSYEQIIELAFGLEMSGQRFLWVIRTPNDSAVNAAYFDQNVDGGFCQFLPLGFLDRTKGLGLVVPSWAPQVEILGHGSTGGFLSHSGWNSILESIDNGVPLIAWPLFAEQKLNAVQLTDDLKVAFRVKHNEKGIIERGQIAKYAKNLIEGEEGKLLRERMQTLKTAAKATWGDEGSSTKKLDELAHKWKSC
ncbi:hypothetical protein Ancab_015422 [Ancistrocladus abbreviatus]